MSLADAVEANYNDLRRAIRTLVEQLPDDEITAELAKDRPYEGRDEAHAWAITRARMKIEARKRGLLDS